MSYVATLIGMSYKLISYFALMLYCTQSWPIFDTIVFKSICINIL